MAGAGGKKFKGRNERKRMRMKVLQVNSVYDFGSTGKITADIHSGEIPHSPNFST